MERIFTTVLHEEAMDTPQRSLKDSKGATWTELERGRARVLAMN
jgi:hypothetical protein